MSPNWRLKRKPATKQIILLSSDGVYSSINQSTLYDYAKETE